MARVKIRRKDLRRPDEFLEFTGRAWDWVVDHRSAVMTVAAAVVVLAGIITGIRQYENHRGRVAAEAFRKATALLAAGEADAAADAFGAVPRVGSYGALSDLYRGHAALQAANAPAAARAFRAAAGAAEIPTYLRQEALYSLAVALDMQGDAPGALAAYEEAGNLPGPFRVDARLAAARLSHAAGASDRARVLYELALSDAQDAGPPQDDLREVANWRLTTLFSKKPEAKIAPVE